MITTRDNAIPDYEFPTRSLALSALRCLPRAGTLFRWRHVMGRRIEVKAGDKYGRLTVVQEVDAVVSPSNGKKYRRVLFQCECGETAVRRLEAVRSGASASCGCLQRETSREIGKRTKHGMTNSSTYLSWCMMKQRCYNTKDSSYEQYGGRSIAVCSRWRQSFEAFFEDMGERPSDCTLERLDVDGDYEPTNCVWATSTEQARNRRSNVMLTFRGKTMCISAWSEQCGIPRKTLEKRISQYNFTVEQALTIPVAAPRKLMYQGRSQTISEWAAETGIPRRTISSRLKLGWGIERALTTTHDARRRQR